MFRRKRGVHDNQRKLGTMGEELERNSEISKFINAYKSASSRLLKKDFPRIRQRLWKEYFWSQSFCLLTTGGAPIDVLRKYIESQGEKH